MEKKIVALAILALLLFAGCVQNLDDGQTDKPADDSDADNDSGTDSPQQDDPPQDSDFQEADDSLATEAGVAEVVSANNRFALEAYSKFNESEAGNIFFSPYSISSALAMTFEGAKGKTADEIQQVFYFQKDDSARRSSHASLFNSINKSDKNYQLDTANALWVQENFPFLEEYFSTVEDYYGGKATNMDFVNKAEESRQTINFWVEEKTRDKIKDLIPSGLIDSMTRLVLTNAIYFKGKWLLEFDEANTQEQDFHVSETETVKAELMKLNGEEFSYYENEELQALELPYKGNEVSMLLLLPKENSLNALENSITPEKLSEVQDALFNTSVNVSIPKFKFETKYFMKQALAEMGMPTAFSSEADFSGMTGARDLAISEVIHQAFVEVNEEGTEAAAATAVIMKELAIDPSETKEFKADHPFIFLIQENETGSILFMGRVSNPAA